MTSRGGTTFPPSNLPENFPQVQSKECDRLKTLLAEAKGKINVPGKSAGDLFLERFSDLQLGEQKGHFESPGGLFFLLRYCWAIFCGGICDVWHFCSVLCQFILCCYWLDFLLRT